MAFKDESSPLRFPAWEGHYRSALHETDKAALFKKVEIAEATMLTHRDALAGGVEGRAEWQAIEDALADLRVLKKERLHFGTERIPCRTSTSRTRRA